MSLIQASQMLEHSLRMSAQEESDRLARGRSREQSFGGPGDAYYDRSRSSIRSSQVLSNDMYQSSSVAVS